MGSRKQQVPRDVIRTLIRKGERLPCNRGPDGKFLCGSAKKHGLSFATEYRCWISIRSRCSNPRNTAWENYGGRGIKVCDRWESFEHFLSDMGRKPSKRHTIERRDVNGDYEPKNCFWATMKEQARNKRNQHFVEVNGRAISLAQAVEESAHNLNYNTVLYRIRRGWSVERALGTPTL